MDIHLEASSVNMTMIVMLIIAYAALMVSGTALTPQPVAIWMMNADTRGKDQSGFGNDATEYDVTLASGPTGVKDTAFKFYGRATSYLSIKGSNSLDVCANGSFSFTTFVKLEKTTSALIEYVVNSYTWGLHVWSYPANNLYTNLAKQFKFSNLVIPLNKWSFVSLSYDAASSKLIGQVDAMTEERATGSINPYTKTPTIILGKRGAQADSFLLGQMSCAMMFSVSLSPDDMNRVKKYCMKRATPHESAFKKFSDGDIPADKRLQEVKVRSTVACTLQCHMNDGCMSVSYRTSDGTCVLSNVDFFSESVQTLTGSGVVVFSVVF